MTYSLTRIWC